MSYTRIIFAVWAIVGTMLPSGAQTMVTKYLHEFDTLGSGHPNDSINDQPAFRTPPPSSRPAVATAP